MLPRCFDFLDSAQSDGKIRTTREVKKSSLCASSSQLIAPMLTSCTEAQVKTMSNLDLDDTALKTACPSLYYEGSVPDPNAIHFTDPASITTASIAATAPCKAPVCVDMLTKFADKLPNCVSVANENVYARTVIAHEFCTAFGTGDLTVEKAKAMAADFAKQLGENTTTRPPTTKTSSPSSSNRTPIAANTTEAPKVSNTTTAPKETETPGPSTANLTDTTTDTVTPVPSATHANKTTPVPTTQPPKSDSNGRTTTAIAVLTLASVVASCI